MDAKELDKVRSALDTEGVDYGLNHYSNFKTITDEEFQRRLSAYREARKQLLTYLNYK